MHIVELRASNVKRLVAVHIKPDGNVVVLGGANEAGKSSVLDAIMFALGGGRKIPATPVRKGAAKGKVTLDLGEFTVTRTFTRGGGGQLVVTGKDGQPIRSPQGMLDALVTPIAFDPLAFLRMDAARQVETLRALLGIDTSGLDAEEAELREKRLVRGRSLRELEGSLAQLPPSEPDLSGKSEIPVLDAVAALQEAEKTHQQREMTRREEATERLRAAEAEARCRELQAEIERIQDRLEAAVEAREIALGKAEALRAALEESPPLPELAPVRERISELEATNVRIRRQRERDGEEARAQALRASVEECNQRLAEIVEERRSSIAGAEFPIPGMALTPEGIELNGLPLEQASQSQRLRVSVAMGLRMNADLRVMLCREASFLDEKNLSLMAEMAEQAGAQLWLERVGRDEATTVLIEDGQAVAGRDVVAAEAPTEESPEKEERGEGDAADAAGERGSDALPRAARSDVPYS